MVKSEEFEQRLFEVREKLETFLVLLNLSFDTTFNLLTQGNENGKYFTITNGPNESYIMRVCMHSDEITIVLDKSRFKSGIFFHYKLKNYEKVNFVETKKFLKNSHYWFICSKNIEVVDDVISVINKRVR